MIKNLAIIVAAGTGTRFGGDVPKQYIKDQGQPILRKTITKFQQMKHFDQILIVINPNHLGLYQHAVKGLSDLLPPVYGGESRQESVFNALKYINDHKLQLQHVYIHDAVRFYVKPSLIQRIDAALLKHKAVIPVLDSVDTIKEVNTQNMIIKTHLRNRIKHAQTPQAFHWPEIWLAHQQQKGKILTDDAAVMEHSGYDVYTVKGDLDNVKITHMDDLINKEAQMEVKTGIGFDVHAFESGRPLILCGVSIAHEKGLKGHSDADVALHAITDAVLGAMGKGDIGEHFPPSEMEWKDKDSSYFLEFAIEQLRQMQGTLMHMDLIIMGEEPKISPYKKQMLKRLSEIMKVSENRLNIKATTTEQLGFIGRKEGLAAQAVATIKIPSES